MSGGGEEAPKGLGQGAVGGGELVHRAADGPRHRPSQTAPRPAGFRGRAKRTHHIGAGWFLTQRMQSSGDAEGAGLVFRQDYQNGQDSVRGWALRATTEICLTNSQWPTPLLLRASASLR